MRTHFTALPSIAELKKIMVVETIRDIPEAKQNLHYADFSFAKKLLKHFHLPEHYFDRDLTLADIEKENLLEVINTTANDLLERILTSPPEIDLYNAVYDYLAEEDIPQPAELIFVFGAKTPARIEKAIELYHQGLAPKIMLSGGSPFYAKSHISEAEQYLAIALSNGVKSEDIIIETTSVTIPDNVGTSLKQLESTGQKVKSFILINSPYSQRRGWCVFKKHTLEDVKLYRVNSATADQYCRANWYKNPEGVKIIFNELVKLKLTVILNTA